MKKSFFIVLSIISVFSFFVTSSTVFATGTCDNVTVEHVGNSVAVPSGVIVYFKNDSGVACPDFPIGATRQANLATTHTDKMLALLLTAASLKRKVKIFTVGTSAPYILSSVMVKEIAQ